jgi:hypothetical protein
MLRRRGTRPAPAAVLFVLLVGLGVLAACEGRTILEGDLLNAPPTLTVDHTVTSAQVHAGTTARIRLRAESPGGIDRLQVQWTGPAVGSFTRTYPDHPASVVVDTAIAVPAGVDPGDLAFTARAVSAAGVPREVTFAVRVLEADLTPPEVSVASVIPDRMERDDSLAVTIRCRDTGTAPQLAWCGYSVLFYQAGGDTLVVTGRDTVPAGDTAVVRAVIPVQGFDPATLPTDLLIEVHGFAIDASGNCAAGIGEAWSQGPCRGTDAVVADVEVDAAEVTVVASTTIHRSWGGILEELAVDEKRGRLYASVIDRNRIEVLDFLAPRTQARQPDILVGSRPAGITMDHLGDTLIVANSGGTSLSFVDLDQRREHNRMETHNAALYNVHGNVGSVEVSPDTTIIESLIFWEEFGDRPHRVAQDSSGIIFYSTEGGGPIRMVRKPNGGHYREANIMLWSDVLVRSEGTWAVTYVDSMVIRPESIYAGGEILAIYDHVPGRPDLQISVQGTPDQIEEMLLDLQAQGSDVFFREGWQWDMSYWHVGGDAMFATSRDRSTIAIADGDRAWTWIATGHPPGYSDRLISWYLSIDDLRSSLGLGIEGVAADFGGDQFAVRGGDGIVYFDNLLRVHGTHRFPALSGQAGVAMHPTEDIVFAPTDDRSIMILQRAGHYQVVANLPLVERLVGPIYFSLRRNDDPADLAGRIHGINESGNVVTLPVRHADFQ